MSAMAPVRAPRPIPRDLLRPSPVTMTQVSAAYSLATVAPAYWASLTPEEQRLLRHVRLISGGLLVKVNPPTLPQAFVSPDPGPITGLSITVLAGGDVQAAFNQAAADDPDLHHQVILEEGVAFVGNLLIPPKRGPGTGWITVRSRALAALPPAGERITRAHSPLMPKLVSPNLVAALAWNDAPNSAGWRFVGIESTPSPALGNDTGSVGSPGALQLWWFGWNGTDPSGNGHRNDQAALDKRAQRCIIDRCYIHPARDKQFVQRALTLNIPDVRLIGSIVHGQGAGQDCQGLFFYIGGGGPKLIENNEILGTGQNIFFGGAGSGNPAVFEQEQPKDVIVRRNWMHKLDRWNPAHPSWDGINWTVKPIIEIKEIGVARALIEGNLLENAFAWGPIHWATHSAHDVTVQYNVARNCGSLGTIWDTSGLAPSRLGIRRIKYWHNLFEGNAYAVPVLGPDTGFLRILVQPGNTQDLWVEHNTFLTNRGAWGLAGTNMVRSRFANNVIGYGNGGVTHEGSWLWRDADWDARGFTDRDWVQNAYVNLGNIVEDAARTRKATPWAPGLKWAIPFTQATWSSAGGVATGQFIVAGTAEQAAISTAPEAFGVLGTTSQLRGIGLGFDNTPDGSDLGVDFAALYAAQGLSPTPAPRPVAPVVQLLSTTTQGGSTMPWTVKVRAGVLDTQGTLIRQPDAIAHRLYRDGVKIQDVAQPATGPTEFTLTVPEPEVVLKLGASALDAAGNESVVTPLDVPLDATAPIPPTFRLVSATWVA